MQLTKQRARRLELGLRLSQLADRIGISDGHLSKIEQGRVLPTIEMARAIAEQLQTPPTALWEMSGTPSAHLHARFAG